MNNWGSEIDQWTARLTKAWESGDMPRFRELAKGLDALWSDTIMDAHAEDLYQAMGKALASGIDRTVSALSALDFALPFVEGRQAVAATLDSAAWRTVPYQLRDRAFFSAKVNDLKTLQEMKARITQALNWSTEGGDGPGMDSGRFAKEMRAILINGGVRTAGAEELGTLKDVLATQRMKLVYQVQTDMARGYATRKVGMDRDILDAVPGYVFTRVVPRRNPRPSAFWQARWAQAAAQVDGRGCLASPMVCLKTSPVLQALGNLGPFGNPFDPFDYGTGMGLQDLDRAACEAAGLIERGEELEPVRIPDLTERLEEGVAELQPAQLERLKKMFGSQIEIKDGTARWVA